MPRCPSCYVPMIRIEEAGLKYFNCGSCFGHWIANIALQRRCKLDVSESFREVSQDQSLTDLAEVVALSHSTKELRCPHCERPMKKGKFHPMIPVMLDRCAPCNSAWLDTGELSLIRLLYRELLTSDDPEILRRREKIAGAFVAWEGREKLVSQMQSRANAVDDVFDFLAYTLRVH